jgi:alpha-D-ribose 1-methylphosphonate 5-phosphate C-P lyase
MKDQKGKSEELFLKLLLYQGYQVPFASREMPIARGWGTGGLQITLSLIGKIRYLKSNRSRL